MAHRVEQVDAAHGLLDGAQTEAARYSRNLFGE